jgi:hypothetical protein
MHHRNSAEQKAYYRREATECAVAASATSVAEVKQACSTLNRVGCPLAPKGNERSAIWSKPVLAVEARHVAGHRKLLGRRGG